MIMEINICSLFVLIEKSITPKKPENVGKTIPDDYLVDSRPLLFSYHHGSLQVYQGGDGQDKDIWPEIELSEALVHTRAMTDVQAQQMTS